jgi:hypothetical protein
MLKGALFSSSKAEPKGTAWFQRYPERPSIDDARQGRDR